MIEREKGLKAKYEHNMRKKSSNMSQKLEKCQKNSRLYGRIYKKWILKIAKKCCIKNLLFFLLPRFSTSQNIDLIYDNSERRKKLSSNIFCPEIASNSEKFKLLSSQKQRH